MIIDFERARQKRCQEDNKFRNFVIDALCPRDTELDDLLDRLSLMGIKTIGDFLDQYSQEEFYTKICRTERERNRVASSLRVMNLNFTQ